MKKGDIVILKSLNNMKFKIVDIEYQLLSYPQKFIYHVEDLGGNCKMAISIEEIASVIETVHISCPRCKRDVTGESKCWWCDLPITG